MIIEKNVFNEITINKSRFLTYLYKVKNFDEFTNYLTILKKEYKDATHICYAYIIAGKVKFFDDNEPQGTAGIPLLEVLKKKQLNYVACFVIRYFGGIKLGSGGLIRAYSKSASLALEKTAIINLEKLFKLRFDVSYQTNKLIANLLPPQNILKVEYKDSIKYEILVNQSLKDKLDEYQITYTLIETCFFN